MEKIYKNKNVVVTGHTGFKGSWLVAWLKQMGASVSGIALDPPSIPSHYDVSKLAEGIQDHRIDIRNVGAIEQAIFRAKPDFLFHLAAQPIVGASYDDPIETWSTNVMGTINVLEALRKIQHKCSAVIITSDKCYDNVEWEWGYRENDDLGGPDPYSASKGAAELAIRSYVKSYFSGDDNTIRIVSARAGNVIGGGDWAENRIVPDCVQSWSKNEIVELRNPHSTRPWQHVLEPLGGYLQLGALLSQNHQLHGEAFNFGPQAQQNHSVLELVEQMSISWSEVRWAECEPQSSKFFESGLLKLNCDKALHLLNWHAVLNFEETVALTADWYRSFYVDPNSIQDVTHKQINDYAKKLSFLI
ncbi:CDP-glucose 4,6-dehydratase [Alphaproteobacteria bacterium]|nr:CDP-glucose 4,6-dehydratase [Alphaproteobacteria bacterium]